MMIVTLMISEAKHDKEIFIGDVTIEHTIICVDPRYYCIIILNNALV